MRQLSKVVWSEGMYLAQHHFQAQSRYFEDSIQFALAHLFFKSYGLAGCALDADALRNGTVALVHARGVLPDGLAFNIPESDPPPEPREVRDVFSPTHDSHLVLLSIPAYRPDGPNSAVKDSLSKQAARYIAQPQLVLDETTGHDEKPVAVGRKNFRLVLDIEADPTAVSLPLARVRRDGMGSFVYDRDYIPPLLQVGASERLVELVQRLVEILDVKSEAIAGGRQAGRIALGDFARNEVASFWLLHTMHSSMAPLRHHVDVRQTRPEQLYAELARLAGALCTFALESHPRAVPGYDHDRLQETFEALDRHIRTHLDVIIPTSMIHIPLQRTAPFYWLGTVPDKRCFHRARWILGVRARLNEGELINAVPRLVKVYSARFLSKLVERALPGLALEHLPVPPAMIAPRYDTQYFSVGRAGPCWDTTIQTEQVGIYAPDAFPEADLDLVVLLEQ